ncbi:type II toxin-antitoxin system RelE/ParE family toxin [Legionella shakespearei]|uniref:Toxin n=1 Tax=Legionella shakespearei DSM 23087 TaxID=1122169 RepID=A0A0W0YV25_9GAMM|nr:type II toxin-antitoxin system RelE/ParE family toxin [Legionella shakespearei]KTD60711.1 putative toxin antitoxin plasmid stabilization system ParE [Legionella shakespearei DSM 23087]
MIQYQLTSNAKEDLIHIRRFTLNHWGAQHSAKYLEEIKSRIQLLAEMPLIEQNCFEDVRKDVYRFLYGAHTIYYIVTPETITIIAILHQSMIPASHLGNRL